MITWTQIVLALLLIPSILWRLLYSAKRRLVWYGPSLDPNARPTELPPDVVYKRLPALGTQHLAIYYQVTSSWNPWVVHCHGIMNNCETSWKLFEELGGVANILVWDYRGFGRSTGSSDETVTLYDLNNVLNWLTEAYKVNIEDDVILSGHSLGTNVVLGYVRDQRKVLPSRLILSHPFCRLSDVLSLVGIPTTLAYLIGNMDVSDVLHAYLYEEVLRKKRTVLLLGAKNDSVTPWRRVQDIVTELPPSEAAHVRMVEVGGSHFSPPPLLWQTIRKFIEKE